MDTSEILARIRLNKQNWEINVENEKLAIEADIALIQGKKKKGSEWLIGSTITANKIRAMTARSYFSKSPINIRSTQVGNERIVKAFNKCYLEDRDSPYMRALRYYKDRDKFITWVGILAKTGWDGKRKMPTWSRINPLLAVPDPYGDYFIGDYRYIGFYDFKTKAEMEELWWETEWCWDTIGGVKDRKETEQLNNWLNPTPDKEIFDIFYYFEYETPEKVKMYVVNGNTTHILAEKTMKEMPFTFFYWEPNGSFFGNRVANWTRDTDKWKAEQRNIQAETIRNNSYTMWLYNSDYVSGKDITFGINRKVPVKSGLDGASVSLSNLIAPAQKTNVNVQESEAFMQSLEQDVAEWTSIDKIAQGSTPERREALGTNKLVMENTDINLSLNEEMDAIGEQQFVLLWASSYKENFTSADKKVIYAGQSTWQSPIILSKKDFVLAGNLSMEVETSKAKEERQRRENAWRVQQSPLILQDPNINDASKRIVMRNLLLSSGAELDNVEQEVPMTAQYLLQLDENEAMKREPNTYFKINPDDDDEQHLVAMWDYDPENIAMVQHALAHKLASIQKEKEKMMQPQDNQMLSGAMSQAMSQAGSQVAKSNQQ